MTSHTQDTGLCSRRAWLGAALLAAGLSGCSALKPSTVPQPAFFALEPPPTTQTGTPAGAPARAAAPTLMVRQPRASAGYDSQRIIYTRTPHKLEYFSHSEWVDPPARMLGPLLVEALRNSGAFRAVVLAPGVGMGELQLETQILRLEQDFLQSPSQVRFALRATLVEERSRRVLATQDFEAREPAPSDDPYGGVQAANRAVHTVLARLATYTTQQVRLLPPPDARSPTQQR